MREIKAYSCDYCNKLSAKKSTIKAHEKICFLNPLLKSCITCEYFTHSNTDIKNRRCIQELDIKTKLITSCEKYNERVDYNDESPF